MDRESLEGLGREELVVEARRNGVKRPEVMTRVELVDEVLRLGTPNPVERKKVRGWLGIARDMIASAVELGLNLPDAAAMIRGDVRFEPLRPEQPPVATVTLAEIYGAQGHFDRAVGILDEVLERESDHEVARRLRARLGAERDAKAARQGAKAAEMPERSNFVSEAPEPRALEEEEEPDHVTLVPLKPDRAEFAESDDDDHATLIPVRPDAVRFTDDDSEHVTLVPVRPDGATPEVDVDLPTLPPMAGPARSAEPTPENGAASVDEPELPTLFPAKSASSDDPGKSPEGEDPGKSAEGEHPGKAPEGEGGLDEDWDRPTNPPLAGVKEAIPALNEPTTDDGHRKEPAVVFARMGSESVQVYFELGSLRDSHREPIVLRVVEHRPRIDGVERVERDVSIIGARGTATLLGLESGSFVRAALGRKWDGRFHAAAVAAEIRMADDAAKYLEGNGRLDVAWAPRPGVNYEAVASRAGLPLRGTTGIVGKTPD
jgi:hypothetical protein